MSKRTSLDHTSLALSFLRALPKGLKGNCKKNNLLVTFILVMYNMIGPIFNNPNVLQSFDMLLKVLLESLSCIVQMVQEYTCTKRINIFASKSIKLKSVYTDERFHK